MSDWTATLLLQALLDGESYGLQLVGRVKTRTGGRFVLNQGRVYPVLRQLEEDGLVRARWGDPLPERGGRPRRYYELTADGLRVARQDAKALAALLRPALGVI